MEPGRVEDDAFERFTLERGFEEGVERKCAIGAIGALYFA